MQAAERGMKLAMLEVAKAYESGVGLGQAPEGNVSFPAMQRYMYKGKCNWMIVYRIFLIIIITNA